MASREDIGSWLEGGSSAGQEPSGSRLGLPPQGPGSLARPGRRVVALLVDWLVAQLISVLFFDNGALATLGVFALENVLLVSTLGFTLGHRLLGMRVRVLGAPDAFVGILRGLVRTVLLCLVVPAVVWDRDGRGVHDKAAGTVLVRL